MPSDGLRSPVTAALLVGCTWVAAKFIAAVLDSMPFYGYYPF